MPEKKATAEVAKAEADPAEMHRHQQRRKELRRRLDLVTAEGRVNAINEMFCDPTFFDRNSRDHVKKLKDEQKKLSGKVEEIMAEWERIETELAELGA